MEPIEQSLTVVRLPLWRSCLERMIDEGVEYGKTYTAEFFMEHLKAEPDSMQFGLAISEIRRELEQKGYYLSGRGGKQTQWVILQPQAHSDVMTHYNRLAMDALKRGVILGTNTKLDLLEPADRKKHESILEKLAIRTALLSRSKPIYNLVKKEQPKLLGNG